MAEAEETAAHRAWKEAEHILPLVILPSVTLGWILKPESETEMFPGAVNLTVHIDLIPRNAR